MTDEPLKPCPFCGGAPFVYQWRHDMVKVICNCGITTEYYILREYAIAAWNRRAGGWISVEERLPEKAYLVLAYNEGGCWLAHYFSSQQKWIKEAPGEWLEDVTHWQPLPPPPAAIAALPTSED